jgi:hypothetical protein
MNRIRNAFHITSRVRFLVLAPAALVVGIGGTATAATLITGAQIQDGSVYSRDIANGTLTGTDVKDQSLTPTDFTGSLQGPAGPAGPAGPQGPAGVSGLQYIVNGVDIPAGQTQTWGANCPPGKKVVGGGVSSNDPYYARVVESAPQDNGAGWWIGLRNQNSSTLGAYAWAVCATA